MSASGGLGKKCTCTLTSSLPRIRPQATPKVPYPEGLAYSSARNNVLPWIGNGAVRF